MQRICGKARILSRNDKYTFLVAIIISTFHISSILKYPSCSILSVIHMILRIRFVIQSIRANGCESVQDW